MAGVPLRLRHVARAAFFTRENSAMSKSEELFAMGQELGQEWRKDADPVQVEWLQACCDDRAIDMTDWGEVAGAIMREEMHPAEAWSLITGDDYAILEARHPRFVAGFIEGALAAEPVA